MQGRSEALHATSLIAKAVVFYFGAALALAPAFALGGGTGGNAGSAGGGSGGGSMAGNPGGEGGARKDGGSARSMDLTTCPKGEIWDRRVRRCVKARSEALPDEILIQYAYALAKAERYGEALDTLKMVQNPNTPEALNYRGYATRKLGRTEEGIRYYLQAVALDPKYAQVREYLGEAYANQGKVDLAKEQLRIIGALCGTGCEEYEDLAEAIGDAQ